MKPARKPYKTMHIGKFLIQHDSVGYTMYVKKKSGVESKTPGKIMLVLAGHFPTMETTLNAIPEKALLRSDWENLQEVKNIILKYKKLIQQSLNGTDAVKP